MKPLFILQKAHLSHLISSICLFIVILVNNEVKAQTILNTATASPWVNNNGAGTVTFNFQNTNTYPVLITAIDGVTQASGVNNAALWIKTTPVNGSPGAISVANGWNQVAAGTFNGIANSSNLTTQNFLSGLNVIIPAGVTYGMAVVAFTGTTTTSPTQRYYNMVAGNLPTTTISGGGCNIIMGTNISYGAGVPPTAPANTPRGWIGKITFSPVNCSGLPNPGNTLSTNTTPCSGVNFTLSTQFQTSGAGVTYQWESSPAGLNNWTNLGPVQSVSGYTTSQTSSTDYRCLVTCAASGLSGVSTVLPVMLNPVANCYCIPSAPSPTSTYITGFSTTNGFTNITNNGTSSAGSPTPGYSNYTAMSVSNPPSGVINFTLSFAGFNQMARIWVDWNQDADFDDANELVSSTGLTLVSSPYAGSFTVAPTALIGNTRMRIRTLATGTMTSCGSGSSGETEDYTLTVMPACSGILTATIPYSSMTVCTGRTLNLNATISSSQSFQWKQSTTPGGPYVNVIGGTGANSPNYSKTATTAGIVYYVLETQCSACTPCASLSNEVAVTTINSTASAANVTACNSYVWYGITYSNSGAYTHTSINAAGCDSVETLNLLIHSSSNINLPVTACNAYVWNGSTYTNSGSYTATYTDIFGCDSMRNLNLTIRQSNSNASSVTTCGNYIFGGVTYTISGTYVHTFTNAAGCDSVHTLNLTTLNLSNSGSSAMASCNMYVWNGISYSVSGTYTQTFVNAAGCDSVHTLSLAIYHNYSNSNQKAYVTNYSSGTVSVINLSTNAVIATIPVGTQPRAVAFSTDGGRVFVTNYVDNTVSVINTETDAVIATIQSSGGPMNILYGANKIFVTSYSDNSIRIYDGTNYQQVGYIGVGMSPTGLCLSPNGTKLYVANVNANTVSVINTVNNTIIATIPVANNPAQLAISADGSKVYATGVSSNTVKVINTTTNTVTATITTGTSPSSLALSPEGSKLYVTNAGGTVSVINTLTNGLITTISPGVSNLDGLSLNSDGSRLYLVNLNSNNLLVVNTITNAVIAGIPLGSSPACFGKFTGNVPTSVVRCNSYTWEGLTYTASGIYSHTTTLLAGCDSVSRIRLTVNYGPSSSVSVTACNSYFWNGLTYTSSGSYSKSFVQTSGCDSVSNLNLIIYPSYIDTTSVSACNSYLWNGTIYTVSGVYTKSFFTAAGCDSILTRNLTINFPTSTTITASGCTYTWNGITYTNTGTYTQSYTNIGGCDSLIHLNLTLFQNMAPKHPKAFIARGNKGDVMVINVENNTIEDSIITGSLPYGISANPDGSKVYVTNYNSFTVSVISTATMKVINTIPTITQPQGIAVSPDGHHVYVANVGSHKVIVIDGISDTVITSIPVGTQPFGICVSPDGNKVYVTNKVSNTVSVINANTNTVMATIPVGVSPLGICISPNGSRVYVSNASSKTVNVINTATNAIIATVSIPLNMSPSGITITPNGSRVYVTSGLTTSARVNVISTSTNTIIDNVIIGWSPNGIAVNADGSKVFAVSLTDARLYTINTSTNTVANIRNIPGNPDCLGNFVSNIGGSVAKATCSSYTWNGITYTSTGVYTHIQTNAAGCDSISTLSLNVKPDMSDTVLINHVACDSYIFEGQTYTVSGIYTHSYINVHGCDSLRVMNLTVHNSTTDSSIVSACNTYVWNGNTYTGGGVYTNTFTNTLGCDSVHTLHLTMDCTSTLHLKLFLEGYYIGSGTMTAVLHNQGVDSNTQIVDSVRIELRDAVTYAVVAFAKTILHTDGTLTCIFPQVNGSYYVVVKHRNNLETWSSIPILIGEMPVAYDFTIADTQAFLSSQVEVESGVWAFYTGDIDQDENIDLLDLSYLESENNFGSGYLVTDLNGDGNVDLLDFVLLSDHIIHFIHAEHP